MKTFAYIWEFTVRPDRIAEFVAAYGPQGEWVRLFRRDPAYLQTGLLRDATNPHRFVTVDHWRSREACLSFRQLYRAEYDTLDTRCAAYTLAERHIGDFDSLD